MLSLVLGSAAGLATFDAVQLFRNLVTAVLLPLLVGAATQALVPGGQAGGGEGGGGPVWWCSMHALGGAAAG